MKSVNIFRNPDHHARPIRVEFWNTDVLVRTENVDSVEQVVRPINEFMATWFKVVNKDGVTVRLDDRDRTLLERLEKPRADSFVRHLNEYWPLSAHAPFRVEEDK